MTARLSVRLSNPDRDIHITRRVSDVTWREEVPGGFASCTVQLERPLNVTPAELRYYSRLYVYDSRTGDTTFEGRVEDLGRGADASGQVWTVNAVGPSAHAQDTTIPLVYQDIDLGNWRQAPGSPNWLSTSTFTDPAGDPGLQINVPRDTVVTAGTVPGFAYTLLADSDQNLAEVTWHYGEDATQSGLSWSMLDATSATGFSHAFTASSSADAAIRVGTSFPAGGGGVVLLQLNAPAFTCASDNMTASFINLKVRSRIFDQHGSEYTTGTFYATTPLSASNVVEDMLGRGLLPLYDRDNAVVDSSVDYTFTESFAYPGGITAAGVLADLMTLLPTMFWAVWESDPATGLYRFEWSQWPTTVRYDATARDGFASPGSAADLFDNVSVTWTDQLGNPKTTPSTLANTVLDGAGFHRTARIALPTGLSGVGAATQAGQQFLTQHAIPPSAGTLNVARPIYDRVLGRMVQPWEIRPGTLIQVRDVAPTTDLTGDRDGVSVFRVVAKSYSSADNTAVLELDAPAQTLVAQTAALLRG